MCYVALNSELESQEKLAASLELDASANTAAPTSFAQPSEREVALKVAVVERMQS